MMHRGPQRSIIGNGSCIRFCVRSQKLGNWPGEGGEDLKSNSTIFSQAGRAVAAVAVRTAPVAGKGVGHALCATGQYSVRAGVRGWHATP